MLSVAGLRGRCNRSSSHSKQISPNEVPGLSTGQSVRITQRLRCLMQLCRLRTGARFLKRPQVSACPALLDRRVAITGAPALSRPAAQAALSRGARSCVPTAGPAARVRFGGRRTQACGASLRLRSPCSARRSTMSYSAQTGASHSSAISSSDRLPSDHVIRFIISRTSAPLDLVDSVG